jgi:hypothetical protein
MRKKYIVELSEEEREYLHKLISSGSAPARKLNRGLASCSKPPRRQTRRGGGTHRQREIAQMLETSTATVVQRGCANAFMKEDSRLRWSAHCPNRVYKRSLEGRLEGRAEARLIALACSEPPRGGAIAGLSGFWRTRRSS